MPTSTAESFFAKVLLSAPCGSLTSASPASRSGDWVGKVSKAAGSLRDFSSVSAALSAAQQAAGGSDLAVAKTKFVSVVSELQSWASAAGVSAQLRGL